MKVAPSDIASAVLALCAVILTGIFVRRELTQKPAPPPVVRTIVAPPELTLAGQSLGPPDAIVTIVEFADFQCPYCALAVPLLRGIQEKYEGQIRVLYRHLPLETLHPDSRMAAMAAECAGDQGRFEAYHDLLFLLQDSIGQTPWSQFARRAGVSNIPAFDSCVVNERFASAIERDVAVARALDLRGTPAFIIGDQLFEGIPPRALMEDHVAREMRKGS